MSQPQPAQPRPRRPLTRTEIAERAKTDLSFSDGLKAAAELIQLLASGRTNV